MNFWAELGKDFRILMNFWAELGEDFNELLDNAHTENDMDLRHFSTAPTPYAIAQGHWQKMRTAQAQSMSETKGKAKASKINSKKT